MPIINTDDYITISEAQEQLQVHRFTLNRWEKARKLVPLRVFNSVVYQKDQVAVLAKERVGND